MNNRAQRAKLRRRNRRIKNVALVTLGLTALLGGSGFYLYNTLQQKVTTASPQVYLKKESRPQKAVENPEDPFSGALNILLIGSDERKPGSKSASVGMRSDTVMVAHISADRDRVELISIPRDSWVDVPSCELPDGNVTTPQTGKFNAAFALGGQGGDVGAAVACTIQTVENLTGVFIDDYIVINFAGFEGMVNALGGVEFNVEKEIIDPSFGNTHIPAGVQTLDGKTALRYARVRKGIGMDGSDISRIGRQQELMAAILTKAKTKTTDAPAMYKLAGSGLEMVTTSPELGNLSSMAGLAWTMKDVKNENIVFKTVPVVDRGDGANVLWTADSLKLWENIKTDTPISGLSFAKDGSPIDKNSVVDSQENVDAKDINSNSVGDGNLPNPITQKVIR